MKTIETTRAALVTSALALAAWPATAAWAQSVVGPPASGSASGGGTQSGALRDPRLFSLPITPTAHVPLWKGRPVTVEVAGQVPSDDLRDAAIGLIEHEASQLGPEVHVESRIGVVPTMARRSA